MHKVVLKEIKKKILESFKQWQDVGNNWVASQSPASLYKIWSYY